MSTENVAYFLGAGFSAPLGLPTTSNFIEKSKDLYVNDPDSYPHFTKIYETLNEISRIKNYFNADLFNIEEVLSILEMSATLNETNEVNKFKKYIIDVIDYYTPPIDAQVKGFHINSVFYNNPNYNLYVAFFLAICNLKINMDHNTDEGGGYFHYGFWKSKIDFSYSFITLNYDVVIEKIVRFIEMHFRIDPKIQLEKQPSVKREQNIIRFAKLHGSVDTKEITLPTWNKLISPEISQAWKLAFEILQNANHIRIIGYSLPETDAYIKYLIKASIFKNPHLKSIDILCRDKQNIINKRYRDFIDFHKMRFMDGDVERYLREIKNAISHDDARFDFSSIERGHESYFSSYI